MPLDVQTKQFIFMMIEPNCSIIAACLPCYGPLFAKGRTPESIIRSVRTAFSLRSRQSSTAQRDSRDATARDGCSTDSQVELSKATKGWPSSENHGTNVSRVETGRDPLQVEHEDGIYVETAYGIDRASRDEESLT